MKNKPSMLWVPAVGILFLVLQGLVNLFGIWGADAQTPPANYLFVLLAGLFNGLGLIYFLGKTNTRGGFNAILIAAVIAVPFALFGMTVGGLIGAFGIFFFGIPPFIFIVGIGYFLGRSRA